MGLLGLPLANLKSIIEVMQLNYSGCLGKMYLLNPSFGLSTTWSIIEKFMD